MSLYLIRHGETEDNLIRRIQGQSQTPLNELGVQQAHAIRLRIQDLNFDRVYCSKILRAIQTAQIIENVKPIIYDSRLNERSYGIWENQLWDDVFQSTPDLKLAMTDLKFRPPNGESIKDVIDRTINVLREILDFELNNKKVLIVGHGGPIKVISGYINGMAEIDYYKQKVFKNCELSQIK